MLKISKKAAAKKVSVKKVIVRTSGSRMLAAIHETVEGLHREGFVDLETMREFDALCVAPVLPLKPKEIVALRRREKVSQPVFAHYLNVSKSSVSKWERGDKHPDGAALKLLNLVRAKGLKAIA